MIKFSKKYDLEERTELFSKNTILLCKEVKLSLINKTIIEQLIRSTTSIGANYCEANEAESKKDFVHKISICKKEIKETKYWLKLLLTTNPEASTKIKDLQTEARELLLIFSAIIRSAKT